MIFCRKYIRRYIFLLAAVIDLSGMDANGLAVVLAIGHRAGDDTFRHD